MILCSTEHASHSINKHLVLVVTLQVPTFDLGENELELCKKRFFFQKFFFASLIIIILDGTLDRLQLFGVHVIKTSSFFVISHDYDF